MCACDSMVGPSAVTVPRGDGAACGGAALRSRRRWPVVSLLGLGLVLLAPPPRSLAQQPDTAAPPGALKKPTLEKLMNLEGKSVSRRPEKMSQAASPVQGVTQENISPSA